MEWTLYLPSYFLPSIISMFHLPHLLGYKQFYALFGIFNLISNILFLRLLSLAYYINNYISPSYRETHFILVLNHHHFLQPNIPLENRVLVKEGDRQSIPLPLWKNAKGMRSILPLK